MKSFDLLIFALFTVAVAIGEVKIERISTERGSLYESPYWDNDTQLLYWLDINDRTLSIYNGTSVTRFPVENADGPTSCIYSIKNKPGHFILGVGLELREIQLDPTNLTQESKTLYGVPRTQPDSRFNDGKCDKNGRLWIGTMSDTPLRSTVYYVDGHLCQQPEAKISPISISNGLAWTKDDKIFFYNDSPTRLVAAFDYDLRKGELSNRRIALDLSKTDIPGVPDGMTIDTNDNLWIAIYEGSVIIKLDSKTGEILERHTLPAAQVTSAIWGGPNLDILYVTTGSQFLSEEALENQPGAGHVYAITGLGESGFTSNKFDLAI